MKQIRIVVPAAGELLVTVWDDHPTEVDVRVDGVWVPLERRGGTVEDLAVVSRKDA